MFNLYLITPSLGEISELITDVLKSCVVVVSSVAVGGHVYSPIQHLINRKPCQFQLSAALK